mmetsp:Transcript_39756/g.128685  ORF Transcript_39756/g.128685 Transcript_39756/m.128685 type:complete len:269 (+) Transcript_39756:569-1375(+)
MSISVRGSSDTSTSALVRRRRKGRSRLLSAVACRAVSRPPKRRPKATSSANPVGERRCSSDQSSPTEFCSGVPESSTLCSQRSAAAAANDLDFAFLSRCASSKTRPLHSMPCNARASLSSVSYVVISTVHALTPAGPPSRSCARRSAAGPLRTCGRSSGARPSSRSQCPMVESGATTRNGPSHPHCTTWCRRQATTCMVLPRPISSPRITERPCFRDHSSQFAPSRWYVRSVIPPSSDALTSSFAAGIVRRPRRRENGRLLRPERRSV